jgi:hypothetical protein
LPVDVGTTVVMVPAIVVWAIEPELPAVVSVDAVLYVAVTVVTAGLVKTVVQVAW